MRIALFSDIHGNLVALEAVLAANEARGVYSRSSSAIPTGVWTSHSTA